MVIKALSDGVGHAPFRDSKLTRLLSDSLGEKQMWIGREKERKRERERDRQTEREKFIDR